ncbi:hypothetical protein BDZ89DRAFT_1139714 [Hymenopellis radicata]|nr:hypothetical protein BDZ89DRAFT_1139714 [Hymenopellis radicata]
MPVVARTVKTSGVASRTSRASSATGPTREHVTATARAALVARNKQRSDHRKRALAKEAEHRAILARNDDIRSAEQADDPDEATLEAGHVAPIMSVQDDDNDNEEGEHDDLPPSDFDDGDELPIASSDPIDYDASSDDIVVAEDDPFATPVKRTRKCGRGAADDGAGSDGLAPAKSAKVTRAQISPASVRFGTAVKKELVLVTAMSNPYPGTLNRVPHVEGIMQRVAEERAAETDFLETYNRLKRMPEKWQRLTTWIMYARGGFIHTLIATGRKELSSLGLPGTMKPAQIVDVVTWMVKNEAWKFGGFNILTQTFDRAQPFGAAFFEAIPRTLFMEGKGKANSETFRFLIEVQKVPLVFMALTMTAIEHCINEWRDGTHRTADFKEDAAVRYLHHLAGVEHVQQQAPLYMANLQSELFKHMLIHTNKTFLLENVVSDVIGSLDFAALEQSVSK